MAHAMNMKIESSASSIGADVTPSVLVMGMGVTGASCARYFAAQGVGAQFVDSRAEPPCTADILDAMPDARMHPGSELTTLPETIRKIVISPGVDLNSSLIRTGRDRGVEIVSDIDLFVAECKSPIIAVTGSNGKSTVTAMLGVALPTAGCSAAIGGNLGTPALDLLHQGKDVYVLELSSFQLERSAPVPAAAATVLNISPDHLDMHGDMQAYTTAKALIYSDCRHAIVNRDVPELMALVPETTVVTTFGLGDPAVGEFGLRKTQRGECLVFGESLLLSADELPVRGRHNLANALAALALGAVIGADIHAMAQALKRYRGLPHRMQVVADADGVVWIDDSKATNVAAAAASIAGVADPFILIAGGDGKGASFEALAAVLTGRQCAAILLGRDARQIADVLEPVCDLEIVPDMAAAVAAAHARAGPGYTVLLAPACSSLDMFDSYVERGEVFAAVLQELTR